MPKIRAMVVKPGVQPEVMEVHNSLDTFKGIVGGYIEVVHIGEGVLLVCNEEGKILDLKPNRRVGYDTICGDFVLVGYNGGSDFISLTDDQVDYCSKLFNL